MPIEVGPVARYRAKRVRRRWWPLLLAALPGSTIVLSYGTHAGASEPAPSLAERTSLGAEWRSFAGRRNGSLVRVQTYGAAATLSLTPALDWRVGLFGLRLNGLVGGEPSFPISFAQVEAGTPAPFGFGADTSLVLKPWPTGVVRPYATGGVGFSIFPTKAFLPGGDHYGLMLRSGVGLDVVANRLSVGLQLFVSHTSNGQGIGAHNPALDAYGGALRLTYNLAPPTALPSAWASDDTEAASGSTMTPSILLEGAAAKIGDLIAVARLRVAQPLAEPLLVVLDGEIGSLAGATFGEVGVGLVTHLPGVSFGAHGGLRRYVGTSTWVFGAQVEGHLLNEMSTFVALQHESNDTFGKVWRTGAGLRAYPHPTLMLELGAGIDGLGGEAPERENEIVAIAGVDWALPLDLEDWRFSVFAESQLSGVRLAGLRIGFGGGSTPRDYARKRGWRRVR